MSRHTNTAEQYKRLRGYLSPAFAGPNTTAILTALASSVAVPLVDLLEQINDQLYICTASGTYLDDKLAEYGVSRPPVIGLSDELFRELGIAVINRKQIRSLILDILSIIFGQNTTNANVNTTRYEPYFLQDNEQLLIAFDGGSPITVTFTAGQFTNINAALAEEVADAITKSLRAQGKKGSAYVTNDGVGNLVTVQSDTQGPSSQVEILGGRAQNALQFPGLRPTTAGIGTYASDTYHGIVFTAANTGSIGNSISLIFDGIQTVSTIVTAWNVAHPTNQVSFSGLGSVVPPSGTANLNIATTWTVTPTVDGGAVYTWTGAGSNPSLDFVHVGDYVNIFDYAFDANVFAGNETNQGTFTVVAVAVDGSSFTVQNFLLSVVDQATSPAQFVAQSYGDSVLFYEPIKDTIASLFRFASVYQSQANLLEIIMPATSQIIRRDRIGAMYIHDGSGTHASTTYSGIIFTAVSNGTVGNSISLTFDGTSDVATIVDAWNLANPTNTVSFSSQQNHSSTTYDGILFVAENNGSSGSLISLTFDGIATVNFVVNAWNLANPTNQVLFDGLGTFVPSAGVAQLSGFVPPFGVAALSGGVNPDEGLLDLGPYTYDPQQLFTLLHQHSTLLNTVSSTTGQLLFIQNSEGFPDAQGYVMIDFGTENQEGPIPYLNVPSSQSILLSPAYVMQKIHAVGASVNLVLKQNVIPATDGSDYQGYVTTVAAGRIYGQTLIESIVAAGLNIVFTIVYPNTIGLGRNEAPWVWGETTIGEDYI